MTQPAPPIPKGFLAALAVTVILMIGSLYGPYHPRDWKTHVFSLMTGALPLAWLAYRRQGKSLSGGDFILSVLSFPLVFAGCSLLERWYYRR
jgi:hypothetical protein